VGTASAALQYSRRVVIPGGLPPCGHRGRHRIWFGARAVVLFPPAALRPLILVLLIAVAIYTFMRKDFGVQGRVLAHDAQPTIRALAIGAQSVSTTDSSAQAPAAF
jgi:hypothetical protein